MKRFLTYLFVLNFLLCTKSFAQEKRKSEYHKNLHQTDWNIRCLYSLPNGLVLCGTEGGMILHDGFKFTEIKMDRYEAVNNIYWLSESKLLLVRENTLVELDYKQWNFKIIYKGSANKNELFFASIRLGNFIYLGTSVGLQKWSIPNGKMEFLTQTLKHSVSTRSRSLSYNKKDQEVILGVRNGIVLYKINEERASILETDSVFRCKLCVKSGSKYYVVSSTNTLFVKQNDSKLIPIPLNRYFDSGFKIHNFLEYKGKLIISTKKHGTILLDLISDSFIKNDPIFGSINEITSVSENLKYRQVVIGTSKGLISIAQPPVTFSVLKDSLPVPVYACHATYDKKNQTYYYLSGLNLIEFKIGYPGYNKYDFSTYLLDNKYATLKLFDNNTLIIFGHKQIFFDLSKKQFYHKTLFSAERQMLLDNDLIIDCYASSDNKLTMFSTYRSGLFVKDDLRDTQYVFKGSDLGCFSTICKIHSLSSHEFLMGANSFGGVYYLDINTFKVKYYPPALFDKQSVSKSYVRNIFELENRTYFTTVNAIWEFDKKTKNILFSNDRSQLKEGILFYLEAGNKVFLSSINNVHVLTKEDLSLIEFGKDSQNFAFLVPVNNGVAVYSGNKLLRVNLGSKLPNLSIHVSHIVFENRMVFCDDNLNQFVCRYDDPLLNLSFFVNYPHFKEYNGKIYYQINKMENWQVLESNVLNLAGMKPGKYLIKYFIKLKAKRSIVKYFTLIINPPWYQEPLFEGALLIVLIILTVFLVRRRLKTAKQNKLKEIELVLNSLEAERARLSKDLHDGVSPNLSALKMILNNADLDKSKFMINPDKLIDATLAEIKEILHNITPDTLKQNGLASTISSYITNTPYESIKINFNSTMLGVRYSEAIEINVYRIFQELFNNAIKYSGCKEINIDLFVAENHLNLMLSDDGKGFDSDKPTQGFGIKNIRSRVELLGGTVNIDSSEISGTTVIVKIPLNEKH